MKTKPTFSMRIFLLKTFFFAGIAALLPTAFASTYWNGPNINFTQSSGDSDILVAGKVAIDRGQNGPLYNSITEAGPGPTSPADTLWAVGTPSMIGNLSSSTLPSPSSFVSFDSIRNSQSPDLAGYLLGGNGSGGPVTFVVHMTNEDIYLTLTFSAWGQHFAGGFSYTRSTPSVAAPTPTVSITNPAPNSVFAAPANVTIEAAASVSSGSVTNVSFFNSSSLLGSSQSAPFSISIGGLGAGPYSLTAVATAAGVLATSSVVNVSVVTPVVTSLSGEAVAANNQFVFSYDVNPGLSYVVEGSSDLNTFTPLETNVPSSSPAFFTNPVSGSQNFFRVGRMPNP